MLLSGVLRHPNILASDRLSPSLARFPWFHDDDSRNTPNLASSSLLPPSVPSRRRWATRKIALFTLSHCRALRDCFFLLASVPLITFSSWSIYIWIAYMLRVFIYSFLQAVGERTVKTGWKGGRVKDWKKYTEKILRRRSLQVAEVIA